MQYAVPQFTDFEDKLIGPLTLKQFLFLLAVGGIVLFFYSLLGISIFFFIFAVPTAIIGLALAFGPFNGRKLYSYIPIFLSYFSRPQVRIFMREEPDIFTNVTKVETAATPKSRLEEPDESRLKKLAYLLDQKTHEEEDLIGKH